MPSPTLHLPRPPKRTTEAARRRWPALAAAGVVLAGLGAWLALHRRPLPVLGTVPPFSLMERSGQPLGAHDLAGHVWIADFVFTRCPDVCPALTARMAALGKALAPTADPIRLVSFTVDPAHDTPDVLREYAAHAGAGADWVFLTGSRAALAALFREGFKVAWADDGPPSAPITHSDRFVLVDRRLRIRGYYHGSDPADVARLAGDAVALRDGRAS